MFPGPAVVIVAALGAALLSGQAPPLTVATAARSIQPGELVVLTVTAAAPVGVMRATVFGRTLTPFSVDARTWRLLVGVDLDVTPGSYPVVIEAEPAEPAGPRSSVTVRLRVTPKQFRTRHLRVDARFVDPSPDALARIEQERLALQEFWTAPEGPPLWSLPFAAPVPGRPTSAFGSRTFVNGEPRSPHSGADFPGRVGDPIRAPGAGRVVLVADLFFTGHTVVIDHGLGLTSLFAHLSETAVRAGEIVPAGQIIGRVGATGRVTAPHLHWGVRIAGARIDPLSLLALLGADSPPAGAR